jgi:hypothetical protein
VGLGEPINGTVTAREQIVGIDVGNGWLWE